MNYHNLTHLSERAGLIIFFLIWLILTVILILSPRLIKAQKVSPSTYQSQIYMRT
ncbi:MAG: hypothetical protein KKH98_05725 [Spirochaetes bacterium]|nr:hypothetical protein [Spirochaetota bacterium]